MGRLIDGDALYKAMQDAEELARKRVLDTESTLPYPNNLNPAYTRYLAQMDERIKAKKMVADAPTVDAVPVKRGYWKTVTMSEATGYDPGLSGNDPLYGHVCSVCKHEAHLNEEEEEILSNFCPDCGAILVEKGGSE